jgi:hypothetical protein
LKPGGNRACSMLLAKEDNMRQARLKPDYQDTTRPPEPERIARPLGIATFQTPWSSPLIMREGDQIVNPRRFDNSSTENGWLEALLPVACIRMITFHSQIRKPTRPVRQKFQSRLEPACSDSDVDAYLMPYNSIPTSYQNERLAPIAAPIKRRRRGPQRQTARNP